MENSSLRMPGFTAEVSLGRFARGFRGQWSAWRPAPALQPAACDQECLAGCDSCDWCWELPTAAGRAWCHSHCHEEERACARDCGC
jgi:hypothetical protein